MVVVCTDMVEAHNNMTQTAAVVGLQSAAEA